MGTKERRDREREETRGMILEAARKMFAEHGYETVTMRALAEEIEYTPAAIYHHFANKQELVTQLCYHDFRSLRSHFEQAAAIADPIERIQKIGEAYVDFALRFPNQYRFMFMTRLAEIPHVHEVLAGERGNPEQDAYAFLRYTCQEAIAQGRIREEVGSPDDLAQMLWGALHGIISLRLTKSHDAWVPWPDLSQAARQLIGTLTRGILKTATASSKAAPAGRHAKRK